jgi:hypothetical protein
LIILSSPFLFPPRATPSNTEEIIYHYFVLIRYRDVSDGFEGAIIQRFLYFTIRFRYTSLPTLTFHFHFKRAMQRRRGSGGKAVVISVQRERQRAAKQSAVACGGAGEEAPRSAARRYWRAAVKRASGGAWWLVLSRRGRRRSWRRCGALQAGSGGQRQGAAGALCAALKYAAYTLYFCTRKQCRQAYFFPSRVSRVFSKVLPTVAPQNQNAIRKGIFATFAIRFHHGLRFTYRFHD